MPARSIGVGVGFEFARAGELVDETAQPEAVEIDGLRGPALLRLTGNVHGVSSRREL